MTSDDRQEYFTIEEAAAYLGTTRAQLRRVLKEHGLDYFMQASLRRQIMVAREDLDKLRSTLRLRSPRRAG